MAYIRALPLYTIASHLSIPNMIRICFNLYWKKVMRFISEKCVLSEKASKIHSKRSINSCKS